MSKRVLLFANIFILLFFFSFTSTHEQGTDKNSKTAIVNKSTNNDSKGIGKFTSIELTHPLNIAMVEKGRSIYESRCKACHMLTCGKQVGPGWKGVTDRRTPEWIMNLITNTDEMLFKDDTAKALIHVCFLPMPNQHLSDDEARELLEFMRDNDGKN